MKNINDHEQSGEPFAKPSTASHESASSPEATDTTQNDGATAASSPQVPEPPEDYSARERADYLRGYKIREQAYAEFSQEVTLLPVYPRSKKPVFNCWQKANLGCMDAPKMLLALGRVDRNIGVLLGPPSNDLCAIDLDSEARREEFLLANEPLRQSLTTTARRGCQIWVVIDGPYPRSFKIPEPGGNGNVVEFRAAHNQSIRYGQHPEGQFYRVVTKGKPVRLRYQEIRWPSSWPRHDAMSFTMELATYVPGHAGQDQRRQERERAFVRYGAAFLATEKGKVMINQMGVASMFCAEYPVKHFDGLGFHGYDDARGVWKEISSPHVDFFNGDEYVPDRL